ncbi:MAG: hypothetical protein JXB14_02535, partial [Candidatus Altiarchaeota archaeon]|nr:hypothetical protein [Candidatus Altiarchaeota archaeon]
MDIECDSVKRGIRIKFKDNEYRLTYPQDIWEQYPSGVKDVLVDHISYLFSCHLPLFFNDRKLKLNTSLPLFKSLIFENMVYDLLYAADTMKESSGDLLKRFLDSEYEFSDSNIKYPVYDGQAEDRALISFTFGKDSLLTYALSREIGLDTVLVYTLDAYKPGPNQIFITYQNM